MTKSPTLNNKTKDQIKHLIVKIIKKQKPETTQQLVKLLQEKTNLPYDELNKFLIQLESEDIIHFTKKEILPPQTFQKYILSSKVAWYWLSTAFAMATALTVFTIPNASYPLEYIRITIGLTYVLFVPGYVFLKMVFPSKLPIRTDSVNMDMIERISLSIGMSLALLPIVGLMLNFTPWGVRFVPITLSLLALTIVFATIAVLQEYIGKA
jgi:hypothetical protein